MRSDCESYAEDDFNKKASMDCLMVMLIFASILGLNLWRKI
ncbi:hypothetical protein EV14_1580 [Prochlorococcus sp. MIT 0703]|nr:hypothetical protein EV12_0172 [Prochlorococcus sp. MIT 0701]KGG33691.1 hypothetical protein EV14_1580 [Prochlorococcus sp. MIT 0703]